MGSAASIARKQRRAEAFLQNAQAATDRRRIRPEHPAGSGKGSTPRERQNMAQIVPIDIVQFCSS